MSWPKIHHKAIRTKDLQAEVDRLCKEKGYTLHETFSFEVRVVVTPSSPPEEGSAEVRCAHLRHVKLVDLFVSEGDLGTRVRRAVGRRGTHDDHVAFLTHGVRAAMREWKELGFEFETEEPIVCPCADPLIQAFTKRIGGLTLELINPGRHEGFCKHNVKKRMETSS